MHGFFRGPNGFRILFASALIPAVAVALLVRRLPETHGATHDRTHAPRLGAIPRELRGRLAIVMGVTAAIGAISGPAGGFAFVYMENFLKLHASTVTLVVTLSAIPGVLGLLLGRWLADNKGRRITVAVGVLLTAATSLYAYSGGRAPFIIGYVLGVFAGGVFAPGGAAIATEPFPATVRASAGGWIVVAAVTGAIVGLAIFGPVADATGSFAWGAAAAFLPGLVGALLAARAARDQGRRPHVAAGRTTIEATIGRWSLDRAATGAAAEDLDGAAHEEVVQLAVRAPGRPGRAPRGVAPAAQHAAGEEPPGVEVAPEERGLAVADALVEVLDELAVLGERAVREVRAVQPERLERPRGRLEREVHEAPPREVAGEVGELDDLLAAGSGVA